MSDTGTLVYVVDDDASAREGVAGLLRSAGLAAKTFASGEEFLAAPGRGGQGGMRAYDGSACPSLTNFFQFWALRS